MFCAISTHQETPGDASDYTSGTAHNTALVYRLNKTKRTNIARGFQVESELYRPAKLVPSFEGKMRPVVNATDEEWPLLGCYTVWIL
jgi:hypothetical protein